MLIKELVSDVNQSALTWKELCVKRDDYVTDSRKECDAKMCNEWHQQRQGG